jgi:alcohol dehydrogenase (cytochrome c)
MKRDFVGAVLGLALAGSALPAAAQTLDDLKRDAVTPGDVATYGMGWGQQRWSALARINKTTVKRLVPAWT